ncbi:MAG: hypothetical protein QXR45_09405 [Candidatus Bathyarchaeia archaeon]
MKITKKDVEIYCIVIIAAFSITTLWDPTLNYLQFYDGIKKLTLNVTRGPLIFTEEYRIALMLNVTIHNPTKYMGIRIVSLMFRLYLIRDNINEELTYSRVWFKEEPGELINPHSSISKKYNLSINLANKKESADFIKKCIQNNKEIQLCLGDIMIDIYVFAGRVLIPHADIFINEG